MLIDFDKGWRLRNAGCGGASMAAAARRRGRLVFVTSSTSSKEGAFLWAERERGWSCPGDTPFVRCRQGAHQRPLAAAPQGDEVRAALRAEKKKERMQEKRRGPAEAHA